MKEQINLGKHANVHLSELKIEVKEEQIDLYPVPISSQSFKKNSVKSVYKLNLSHNKRGPEYYP